MPARFPDSEILGSTLVSSSPRLIAAVHVLLRLLTPRHPPRALCSLTYSLRHASWLESRVRSENNPANRLTLRKPRLSPGRSTRTFRTSFFDFQRVEVEGLHPRSRPRASTLANSNQRTNARLHARNQHVPEERPAPEQNGADRVRTDDPRLAKPVLSQLSYSPA